MTAKVIRIPKSDEAPVPFDRLLATCAGGAEGVLEREIDGLGAAVEERRAGAVVFSGSPEILVRANRELRSASRVLLSLARSTIADDRAFYELVGALPWERLISPSTTFAVGATSTDSAFRDTRFLAVRCKDAIVDRQRAHASGRRSSIDRREPDLRVVVHVEREGRRSVVEISLDSSVRPLHERGYRTEAGDAPLRETVAAAMLIEAGWREGDERPFVDPFCGSGTIGIEAALIRRGIPPGEIDDRRYGYERWGWFSPPRAEGPGVRIRSHPLSNAVSDADRSSRPIVCADIDPAIVAVAQRNARRAGVADDIEFVVSDVRDCAAALTAAGLLKVEDRSHGLIVSNPPYGERLAETGLAELYDEFGRFLKRDFPGWDAWILSRTAPNAPRIGLRSDRSIAMYNGSLACRLNHYALLPPRERR